MLAVCYKVYCDNLNYSGVIHECDRQTDGRTDGLTDGQTF